MNRVCIYLANGDLVKSIIDKNSKVSKTVNRIATTSWRFGLLNKFKRVVLNNMCPVIPNEILEEDIFLYEDLASECESVKEPLSFIFLKTETISSN